MASAATSAQLVFPRPVVASNACLTRLGRTRQPTPVMFSRLTPLVMLSLVGLGLGCRAELGECDEAAARQIVFRITPSGEIRESGVLPGSIEDGTPLFAGQALMQMQCGNGGFCHAPAATGSGRAGAPRGLDFDLSLACRSTDNCCSEAQCEAYAMAACADEPEGSRADCAIAAYETEMTRVNDAIERLRRNQQVTYDHRYEILATVRDGSMPPGAAGSAVRANAEYYGAYDGVAFSGRVPNLDTREGREVLRNWLACGSPVLEFSDDEGTPGESCGPGVVGDCGVAAPALPPPEPTWPSIYTRLVRPLCLECHQPGNPFYGPGDQELDYSEMMASLTAMSGVQADGSACVDTGTLIVPGDPEASIFYRKLTSDPGCGDIMPLGRESGLPESVLAPIRQWIEAGANP